MAAAAEQQATTSLLRAITAGLYDSDGDEGDEDFSETPLVVSAAPHASLFDSNNDDNNDNNKRRFDALVSSDEDDEGGSSCVSESSAATQRRRPLAGAAGGELTSKKRAFLLPQTPSRSSSVRSSGSCFFGDEGMLLAAEAAKSNANADADANAAPEQPTTPLPPRLRAALVAASATPPPPPPHPSSSSLPLLSPRRLKALGRDFWGDAAPPPPPGSAFDVGLPAECCGNGAGSAAAGAEELQGSEEEQQQQQLQERCRRPLSPFEPLMFQQQVTMSSNEVIQAAHRSQSLPSSLSLGGGGGLSLFGSNKAGGGGGGGGPLGLALDAASLALEINHRIDAAARLAAAAAAGLI